MILVPVLIGSGMAFSFIVVMELMKIRWTLEEIRDAIKSQRR